MCLYSPKETGMLKKDMLYYNYVVPKLPMSSGLMGLFLLYAISAGSLGTFIYIRTCFIWSVSCYIEQVICTMLGCNNAISLQINTVFGRTYIQRSPKEPLKMYMNILCILWTIGYELSINLNQGEMNSKYLVRINTEENTTIDKSIHVEWISRLGNVETQHTLVTTKQNNVYNMIIMNT